MRLRQRTICQSERGLSHNFAKRVLISEVVMYGKAGSIRIVTNWNGIPQKKKSPGLCDVRDVCVSVCTFNRIFVVHTSTPWILYYAYIVFGYQLRKVRERSH